MATGFVGIDPRVSHRKRASTKGHPHRNTRVGIADKTADLAKSTRLTNSADQCLSDDARSAPVGASSDMPVVRVGPIALIKSDTFSTAPATIGLTHCSKTAFHSMTSSASASSASGTVRPSVVAVLRLMTNSNFVGWITGRSAVLAPLSTFPTYTPPRR